MERARAIRVMADYDCWPLWGDDEVGNIDPDTLAITPALAARLSEWAAAYDATLDRNDPRNSGFPSPQARHRHDVEGRQLAEDLQAELGSGYRVRFWKDAKPA